MAALNCAAGLISSHLQQAISVTSACRHLRQRRVDSALGCASCARGKASGIFFVWQATHSNILGAGSSLRAFQRPSVLLDALQLPDFVVELDVDRARPGLVVCPLPGVHGPHFTGQEGLVGNVLRQGHAHADGQGQGSQQVARVLVVVLQPPAKQEGRALLDEAP